MDLHEYIQAHTSEDANSSCTLFTPCMTSRVQSFALADAQGKSDRPPDAVPLGRSHIQNAACFLTPQRLDRVLAAAGEHQSEPPHFL